MHALILSAGLGTRMRPLTENTPKPLLQVGKYRLIEYHLFNLGKLGIKNIVINTSYCADQFERLLGNGRAYSVRITYSHEGEKPLETGGGIRNAVALIESDPFLVLNADIWTDFQFSKLSLSEDSDACLVLVSNPDHNVDGDFHLINGRINSLATNSPTSNSLTYSGIAILRKSILESKEEKHFPLTDILKDLIRRQRLTGIHYTGCWMDIGTPQRLNLLQSKLLENRDS